MKPVDEAAEVSHQNHPVGRPSHNFKKTPQILYEYEEVGPLNISLLVSGVTISCSEKTRHKVKVSESFGIAVAFVVGGRDGSGVYDTA